MACVRRRSAVHSGVETNISIASRVPYAVRVERERSIVSCVPVIRLFEREPPTSAEDDCSEYGDSPPIEYDVPWIHYPEIVHLGKAGRSWFVVATLRRLCADKHRCTHCLRGRISRIRARLVLSCSSSTVVQNEDVLLTKDSDASRMFGDIEPGSTGSMSLVRGRSSRDLRGGSRVV